MTQITIRPLSSHEDYQKTRQIHMAAWGVDAAETIPPLSMHAFQHNGGILLGAYDGQQLVGYSLGTLGAIEAPNRIDQVAAARLKLRHLLSIDADFDVYRDRAGRPLVNLLRR